MTNPLNDEAVSLLMEHAFRTSRQMFATMSDEDCVAVIQEFAEVVKEWQPDMAASSDDPMKVGIACLATSMMIPMAFRKAYSYMGMRLDAINALKNALDS